MSSSAADTHSSSPALRSDFRFWLLCLVVGQLVLWTVLPWLFARSLPLDVVSDGLTWGHEWQWGYFKHPPLPSWTVEAFFDVFGDIGPFLLSQLCIAATYLFVFLLGREMMPARWAAAGSLLLVGVYYFSIPTPEFNHNVAQMPVWAAACFFYFKAWKTGAARWWSALGVAAGLGLLTKYSTVLLFATIVGHFVVTHGWKRALLSAGPLIAAGVCLLISSEHLLWLAHNGFPTVHYAAVRAGSAVGLAERLIAPFRFLAAQTVDLAPALLLAWLAGLRPHPAKKPGNENISFLLWMTAGPPALAVIGSLATGMGLRDMWGAPMWNLSGLLIVLFAAQQWEAVRPKRLGAGAMMLFAIGLAGFLLANVFVPALENRPSRVQWPDREIARTFEDAWRQQVSRPLKIVAADGWLGGLVAMRSVPRPSVWIDADYRKAPWITPQAVARDGVLVLWRVRPGQPNWRAFSLPTGTRILGRKSFPWPDAPKAEPLTVGFGIVPPGGR